ncbi:LamG-like jellyroll fold domain-containing protein [Pseudophaeobacter leonis]|uniref:LamG-like jellyroll fold domain-containing protein n=1 Tax=Pseudophaeobacter leonis TaxID=1144477 RepID=UPI00111C92E3|nr:LamG-like jellyroll fold domain-containing protein [Pseudophaeobacter leonis]
MLGLAGNHDFSSEDRAALALDHTSSLALRNGTIAFQFSANSLSNYQTLFSKDASGNGNGGHLSAYIDNSGKLIVRFQDASESYYFTASNAIQTGISYDFSLNFGSDGVELYLNGARIAYDRDLRVDWSQNTEAVIVGASGWSNTPGETDNIHSYFDGTIRDFAIFHQQLSAQDILAGEPRDDYAYFDGSIDTFDFSRGSGGRVAVSGNGTVTELSSEVSFAAFDGQSLRTADIQLGSQSSNELRGGDGADVLVGQGGNDKLIGMGNDDLLLGGLGADTLYGGDGRDTLLGQSGDDKLFGADGGDDLRGGTGHDTLYGEDGNDWLYGGLGDDLYYGHTWNVSGTSAKDRAVFDGNFADYTFEAETSFDSSRGENVIWLRVTDSANGGADGFYEGSDRLIDIDLLVFADQAVAFNDLL